MKFDCTQPARLASTRLPRKLLLCETGKSLIRHTYEAARRSTRASGVCVATDHAEIFDEVRSFGGQVEIGPGDISVFARFPGDKEFQALLEYKGTGSVKRAPAPVKFRDYMSSGAELLSPLKKELAAQSHQIFRLKLPGARKAAVVCGDDWQFLNQNGEFFEGSILIGRGQVTVMAAYGNTTDFVGLLEYLGN